MATFNPGHSKVYTGRQWVGGQYTTRTEGVGHYGGWVRGMTDEAIEALRRMKTDNKSTRHDLHETMRRILVRAKYDTANVAKSVIGVGYKHSAGDPREAWRAVRANVWKEGNGIGGSISILDDTVIETRPWPEASKKPRSRSQRTQQVMDYFGRSRAFILRWLNAGTKLRVTGGRNFRKGKVTYIRKNGGKISYRGKIKGTGWFEKGGLTAINKALERLGESIPETIINNFEG